MSSYVLRSVLPMFMATHDYNTKKVREALIARARTDEELHEVLLRFGADQAIRTFCTDERTRAEHRERADAEDRRLLKVAKLPEVQARIEAKIARRQFWDRWTLYGHLPLKVATRANLRESIRLRRKMAAGNEKAAAFEEAVALRLKNNYTVVGEAMTITTLLKIADECNVR